MLKFEEDNEEKIFSSFKYDYPISTTEEFFTLISEVFFFTLHMRKLYKTLYTISSTNQAF